MEFSLPSFSPHQGIFPPLPKALFSLWRWLFLIWVLALLLPSQDISVLSVPPPPFFPSGFPLRLISFRRRARQLFSPFFRFFRLDPTFGFACAGFYASFPPLSSFPSVSIAPEHEVTGIVPFYSVVPLFPPPLPEVLEFLV